jgi:hypothetical protein
VPETKNRTLEQMNALFAGWEVKSLRSHLFKR